MIVVEVVVVAAVLFAVAAVAAGRGGVMAEAERDRSDLRLPPPETPMRAEDVRRVRLGLSFRGYTMSEVDTVLDRLAAELAERDAMITELSRQPQAGE